MVAGRPMYTLLGLLILTAGGDASTQERYPGATQVFHVRFDESSDVDYDGWPDGWARRQGPKFPPYVKIGIRDEQRRRRPAVGYRVTTAEAALPIARSSLPSPTSIMSWKLCSRPTA